MSNDPNERITAYLGAALLILAAWGLWHLLSLLRQ